MPPPSEGRLSFFAVGEGSPKDASVIALAERLNVGTIATLDRRRFSVVRPAHLEAFTLVPGEPLRRDPVVRCAHASL